MPLSFILFILFTNYMVLYIIFIDASQHNGVNFDNGLFVVIMYLTMKPPFLKDIIGILDFRPHN